MLKKIAVVFFILLALIVLNWWNVKQSEKKEAIKEQQALLLSLNKDAITKIKVSNAQGHWQLLKRSKENSSEFSEYAKEFEDEPQWYIEWGEFRYLADQKKVEGLLEDISSAKAEKYIAKGKNVFADYGIGPEKSEIQIFTAQQQTPEQTILTGDMNTMETYIYVAKKNESIYLSDQQLKETQTEHAKDYVHKNLMGFNRPQDIHIKNTSGQFHLSKQNNQWQLLKPINILADQLAVEGLLNHLKSFEVDGLIEEKELSTVIKKSLLNKPDFMFEVVEDNQKTKKLYVRESRPKGGQDTPYHAFLYRDDLPYVFKKDPVDPGHFYYTLSDLAVKKVFSINGSEINAFEVIQNNKTQNFIQSGDQWVSQDDKEGPAFGASRAMFALKADRFLKQDKNKNLSVDYTVVLKGKDGQEQSLVVYKEAYKKHNLSYVQAYSSVYNSHLLFDKESIKSISDAVDISMNAKPKDNKNEQQ
ncbi:DUF4340 domain-containing protein [bacterium]|nr:DUF4340 domain-containing protein [bacterium]